MNIHIMKFKTLLLILTTLTFTSCTQRGCQSMSREFQFSKRNYQIIMYSGGDTVYYDQFNGIINNEEHTDGVFYIKDDTLIEVSGDYILKSY